MNMYQPDDAILAAYADVLVHYALNSGQGVKPGEVVLCQVPDVAKPLYGHLLTSLLKAGAQPMMRLLATGFDRAYFDLATPEQLRFFPRRYLKSRVETVDHQIVILADHDLRELEGVDPAKLMMAAESKKLLRTWLNAKEHAGKYTWTLGLYGTEAMAREAKLSLEDYWKQIIAGCLLDQPNPIQSWRELAQAQLRIMKALNALAIDRLHIQADDIDLTITLGEKRRWVGGSGRNIPSFEIFTSPDWRGTEGRIAFNQPLYRYGSVIEGIELIFTKGKVVKATSRTNQDMLTAMIGRKNADKIGEFSLTDKKFSTITKFMANTLFDENIGGPFGNTHIAVGMAYKDVLDGNPATLSAKEWRELGFNDSGEHTDMMSTTNRTVTAFLKDGSKRVIYKAGEFVV